MTPEELQRIFDSIPQGVKTAVQNHQCHKLAAVSTGLDEFTFDKIANYFGIKMANRKNKWRPVVESFLALKKLGG